VTREPVVVFEIVSPSTSRTDRIEKLREYQATASIQRYVILEQETIAAAVFSRLGDDWAARPLTEGDTLRMPAIGVDLPMTEVYAVAPGLSPLDAAAV
jgi:Uma2 family endonuclease